MFEKSPLVWGGSIRRHCWLVFFFWLVFLFVFSGFYIYLFVVVDDDKNVYCVLWWSFIIKFNE